MLKEKSVVDIKKFYEKKYNRKVETYDFSDKEVLLKFIENHPLDSSSEKIALCKDKEFLLKFIENRALISSGEVALLKNKEVLFKYIEKYPLDSSSTTIIFSLMDQEEKKKSVVGKKE